MGMVEKCMVKQPSMNRLLICFILKQLLLPSKEAELNVVDTTNMDVPVMSKAEGVVEITMTVTTYPEVKLGDYKRP